MQFILFFQITSSEWKSKHCWKYSWRIWYRCSLGNPLHEYKVLSTFVENHSCKGSFFLFTVKPVNVVQPNKSKKLGLSPQVTLIQKVICSFKSVQSSSTLAIIHRMTFTLRQPLAPVWCWTVFTLKTYISLKTRFPFPNISTGKLQIFSAAFLK